MRGAGWLLDRYFVVFFAQSDDVASCQNNTAEGCVTLADVYDMEARETCHPALSSK